MEELWTALLQLLISPSSLHSAALFTLQHQHLPPSVVDTVIESSVIRVSSLLVTESSDEMVSLCLQVCRDLISQCNDARKSSPSLIIKMLELFRTVLAKPSSSLHRDAFQLMQSLSASTIAQALPIEDREFQIAEIMRRLK